MLRNVVIDVFLALGVALVLVSCLGVLVFRHVHDRLHFASPAVLGSVCIAVAVMVKETFSLVGDKTIMVTIFLLVVSPIVTHAIGRASRTAQHGDWRLQPSEKIGVEDRGK